MEKTKVMTILGTRPEIIRLSAVMKKLDSYTEHIIVHTNQNYDYELNQIFFDELGLRRPDYVLDVKGETVGEQIGRILAQCEKAILKERPDAVLILGDTNSALACIVAKRQKVVVFHMEAGNRCFDDRVPEEINRRIVDHTSDVNLCYTEHARRNLLREGLDGQYVFVTGSPLVEVYQVNTKNIDGSKILEELKLADGGYLLASIHREENVDNERNLRLIMESLNILAEGYRMPVIFSTHPRTRNRLNEFKLETDKRIIFHKPFGMFDYIRLQKGAFCNLSDSGTIHEDAAILGIPAVNVRESNERPEVYDTGNVVITGVDPRTIVTSMEMLRSQVDAGAKFDSPYDYGGKNCADKVVRLIMGLHQIVAKKKYYL
ncbi:non-hydrolyzing UDP-N-acetylglucosamine 2-epimerase [Chloroflexota bacterium]